MKLVLRFDSENFEKLRLKEIIPVFVLDLDGKIRLMYQSAAFENDFQFRGFGQKTDVLNQFPDPKELNCFKPCLYQKVILCYCEFSHPLTNRAQKYVCN